MERRRRADQKSAAAAGSSPIPKIGGDGASKLSAVAVRRDRRRATSRAFRVAAPTVFNALPQDIRSADNILTFCRLLNMFYFRNAFNQH